MPNVFSCNHTYLYIFYKLILGMQPYLHYTLTPFKFVSHTLYSSSPSLSPFSLYWCTVPALKPRPVRSAERIGLTTTSPCSSLDYSVESSKKKIKKIKNIKKPHGPNSVLSILNDYIVIWVRWVTVSIFMPTIASGKIKTSP